MNVRRWFSVGAGGLGRRARTWGRYSPLGRSLPRASGRGPLPYIKFYCSSPARAACWKRRQAAPWSEICHMRGGVAEFKRHCALRGAQTRGSLCALPPRRAGGTGSPFVCGPCARPPDGDHGRASGRRPECKTPLREPQVSSSRSERRGGNGHSLWMRHDQRVR